MIPINNSDTAWLIVSDFNQENGKHYFDLREDIYDPDVSQWFYEPQWWIENMVGGFKRTVGDDALGLGDETMQINHHSIYVGGSGINYNRTASFVGGNWHDPKC